MSLWRALSLWLCLFDFVSLSLWRCLWLCLSEGLRQLCLLVVQGDNSLLWWWWWTHSTNLLRWWWWCLVPKLCPTLATPWTVACQVPLSMGIIQSRILEWVVISFSRGSSQPRNWTQVSCIAGRFFTDWAMKEAKVAPLCPTLYNPRDYIVHGILQARILEWVAIPFSRGSFQPRDCTQVSCIAGGFLTSWATREAQSPADHNKFGSSS